MRNIHTSGSILYINKEGLNSFWKELETVFLPQTSSTQETVCESGSTCHWTTQTRLPTCR